MRIAWPKKLTTRAGQQPLTVERCRKFTHGLPLAALSLCQFVTQFPAHIKALECGASAEMDVTSV